MNDLSFHVGDCRSLPARVREAACRVLMDRFKRKENETLIKQLFGTLPTLPHCFNLNRAVGRSELESFRCAVGVVGDVCVAVACFRHVRPRRGPEFSELLLLAVDKQHERRGYGGKLVSFVRHESAAKASSTLLVRERPQPHARWPRVPRREHRR